MRKDSEGKKRKREEEGGGGKEGNKCREKTNHNRPHTVIIVDSSEQLSTDDGFLSFKANN